MIEKVGKMISTSQSWQQEEAILKICDYWIFNHGIDIALFYYSLINRNKSINHLQDLLKKNCFSGTNSIIRQHIINSLLQNFGCETSFEQENKNIFFYILGKVDPNLWKAIKKYLHISLLTKRQIVKMLYHLNNLLAHPRILEGILDIIYPIIEKIGCENIFSSFGIKGVLFYKRIPCKFLESNLVIINNFMECFSHQTFYNNSKYSNIIQKKLTNKFPFPQILPISTNENGHLLSMISSTITKGNHYVDQLQNGLHILFHENEFNRINDIFVNYFPNIFPWLIVSLGKDVLNHYNFLKISLKAMKNYRVDLLPYCLLRRIYSDMKLLKYASIQNKKKVTSFDIKSFSIPFLFYSDFSSRFLIKLSRLLYFNINDSDKNIDFDFIRAHNALYAFIQLFTFKNISNEDEDAIFISIHQCLMRISSKIILQNVILDIYSLIFLKKENIFLCNPAHALWLLNILILFTSDPQIMISHFIMSTLFRKSLSNVDQYIMSYKSALLLAVKSKNWIIADHIATIDKTLFALSEVAHKLDDHNCVISMDNNNRYQIEKSLSWNTKFDYNGNDEILIKLFQNRNHDIIEIQKRKIVKEEDINKLCKDEIEKLKKYQHLYKYIKMISTISSGNFDHNSALTIVEVINTNIQKALKYANLFDFDLFPIILLNEKDIPITKDIISVFASKNPLECLVLSLNSKNMDIMSHSLKFIKNNELISKFLHDENHAKSKERHLTKILRKLSILMKKKNINYREFDDLLFKLNINDISCFISDNFQNFRVKQLGYLCDFINDIPLSIHSIIIIYGITKNNLFFYEYIQQLPEIINLNLDAFQLPEIISVLKTYTNLINQVLENVINTIKNDQISIYALIKSFPDYFMRIILHINPTDIYPYLYLCPENTKKVFIAYFSLPAIIKDKIQLDKTSIISKFSLNSHCIIDIHNNILDLIGKNGVLTLIGIDFNLFSYSRTVKILKKHFSYFCNEFPQYLPEISDCLLESLTGIISNISISSLSSEREALQCFNILISLPLDTKTLKKIHILYDFISLLLYDHSSIIYDFKNYGSYQFAEKIAFLCFKLDYYSLGFDFCVEFNIPIHLYSNHVFHCCFSLGFRQEARQWATHSQIDERTLSMCFHKEAAFDTTPLIALVNTPVSYLANRDIAPFNFYHRILVISKGIKSSVTNNELQSYITSHFQPLSRAIDLLVQYEFYDLAMTLITSIYDSKNLIDCFVNHLFLTAISFNHLNELLEFIFNIDPGMSFTLVLWNGMLSFFIQNEMTKSIIFFSEHINALETAAEYCLKLLFKEDVNNEEKIIYLCRCESNLMESLEIRNNKNYPNNRYPFRPSELTTENISKLLKKINVQKSIIQFYLTSKFVEEFGDCIFMFNAETAIHVSAQLLKFGEIILVYDLVEITEISRKQVVMELSKQLLQENASIDIIFHVLEIINQKYPFQFLDIFILFLQCFAEIKYVNLIHLFRLEAVDKKIACLLYIEYDYLEYAYSSAKENSFHDVLPLIANKSSKLGNKNLLCLCEKSLNNIHS